MLGAVSVAVAVVLAVQPWLAAGVTFGIAILALTFTWPLWVIGLMLALGPLDLSFVTGGFKELFPNLGGLDMNGIRLIGISVGLLVVAREKIAPPAFLCRVPCLVVKSNTSM